MSESKVINNLTGDQTLTVIGLVIAGIAALFGIWLTHHFSMLRNKKEAFKTFEKAFSPAKQLFQQGKENSYFIIHTEFPKHKTAMLDFIHILEGKTRISFNEKWIEYEKIREDYKAHGKTLALNDNIPERFEYKHDPKELKRDYENKKKLLQLIEEILAIAKKH